MDIQSISDRYFTVLRGHHELGLTPEQLAVSEGFPVAYIQAMIQVSAEHGLRAGNLVSTVGRPINVDFSAATPSKFGVTSNVVSLAAFRAAQLTSQ